MINYLRCSVAVFILFAFGTQKANAGYLYVSDTNSNTIYKYDDQGDRSVFASGGALDQPRGITIDSHGNVYVANFNGNTIEEYSASGVDLGRFTNTGITRPEQMVFDSSGNLYVSNIFPDTITKYSSTGAFLGAIVTGGTRFVGLAIDSSNDLYVANGANIEKYSSTGTSLGIFATAPSNINGLSIDASGNVYAAAASGTILEYQSNGTLSDSFSTGTSLLYDVVLNGSGQLDAISYTSKSVIEFDKSGNQLGVIDTNLLGPTFGYYQASAVPEPTSLLSLAAGLALVSVARRRFRGNTVEPRG